MVWVATSPTCATNFQRQGAGLRAALAGTQVPLDEPALLVEGTVHGDHGTSDGGQRRSSVHPVGVAREEGGVLLDLDQVEVPRGSDGLVEQASGGRLRVPQHPAVELHVLRVAPDVGDQEQYTPGRHDGDERGADAVTVVRSPGRGDPAVTAQG